MRPSPVQLRIPADRRPTEKLLAWAAQWPERIWAVENCNGLGRLLAQQLVRHGETVVDVAATLSARTRRLSGHSGRKTDQHDARSVAIAAAGNRQLRRVEPEDFSVVLGLLVDRRWHLVSHQHKTICRLHTLLAELQPGGAKLGLSITQAAKLLRSLRPQTAVDVERKQIACELIADWRWLHKRIPDVARRIRDAFAAHGWTLTQIYGIGDVGAATIIAIVGDVHRFPTRGHFAAFNGTAPLDASSGDVVRHRPNRGGNRQINKVIHVAAVSQIRNGAQGRDHYLRKLAEGKGRGEAMRSLKRQLSDVIYRRLVADARRREAVREGQRENET
jgi:transposase